ncbi:threonylcarbamoyl-AMP synthase [Candidatus Marinamargulisbacteria bacterium SCGC AAA071-K20]|nr:threonylcarbamoyl-AMP synthase [Candidatus Marinamargulisbacteria bacterium SCGC AAA071-K20]
MYFRPKHIDKIVEQIKNGDVGVLPFDTIPGLVGRCTKECAERLFEIKGREVNNPMLVIIPSLEHLAPLVKEVSPQQQALIETHWPGPLTLIFEKSENVPSEITGGKPTIAIRFPEYVPLNILLNKLNEPIISTSANTSGNPAPKTILEVEDTLKDNCDFYLDGFECLYQDESTVVECIDGENKIHRQGIVKL